MKITAEQVTERCALLGFVIEKPGFAQHIADICNRPWFPIEANPFATQDELRFVTSQGTVYRITNIGAPKENHPA